MRTGNKTRNVLTVVVAAMLSLLLPAYSAQKKSTIKLPAQQTTPDNSKAPDTTKPGGKGIGVELAFGNVMGSFFDEPVLLIRSACGNRGLWSGFRSPSRGGWEKDEEGKYGWTGTEYRFLTEGVAKTLKNIADIYPGYKGQGYDIAGFVWFQGHKDTGNADTAKEYEDNLVALIKDVRKDLNKPKLPVMIATVGFNGKEMSGNTLTVHQAQMAVAKHPQFAGTVKTVDTRGFWRSKEISPSGAGYHYNGNAETYMLIGDALGRGMLKLIATPKKTNTEQTKSLPRVLLIGDSICGGYQKGVKKLLAGKAIVVKNKGNGQHTWNGLEKLDKWLGDGKWDVIHFNWGLWDVAHRNPESKNFGHLDKVNGKLTTSLADYEKNLRKLVTRLKKTDATLVWASITPVPDGEPGRIKGDEVKYNTVAAKIMAEKGIAIDDLHAEVIRLGRPKSNNVHDTGNLSGKVTKSILTALASRKTSATPKTVKKLQNDFRKLKFGMFIHYNMATYKGVQWVEGYHSPADFNPGVRVDTDAWADAAVSAGMKYGVLTAKHVAGFCLWDSKYTTYDVMHPDCPYQEDLVAQFIKSFKSRGLKVGLYYCWRHPGFGDPKKFKVLPPECDPATHTLDEQNEFQKAQIAELIEKYPDVFYIWNDALDDKVMPADEAMDFLKSIRPDILASSNWWSWGKKGTPYADIAVKELRHFPEDNKAPGETCWKLEQKWFWNEGFRAGNAKGVMSNMAKAHSRNSNFLLNVGPDKKGNFTNSSIKALAEIGKL